jgi:SAM-dependent methyltransferase
MQLDTALYNKRDFWIKENLLYAKPHFRLTKAARLINKMAGTSQCDLLDVGCGPAALSHLLGENISYHGVDIAIHSPASNLVEVDFVENPIVFGGKKFDIIIAQGVFEYIGGAQSKKMSEIARLLKRDGIFIVSYVNFDHRDARIYAPYNNIQPRDEFAASLRKHFDIQRFLPTSHHIHGHEPNRSYMKQIQLHINMNVPFISRRLAVEYFFVCSKKER